LAEHPLEQMLPALLGAIDRGDYLDRQLAGLAGFEQHFQIARADHADQSLAAGGLPGGKFERKGFHDQLLPIGADAAGARRSRKRVAASRSAAPPGEALRASMAR